jgi:hypothetical protein
MDLMPVCLPHYQIDDIFAITDLYKARNDDEKKFRIDGADCESHLEQQDRINAMLPPGSDYKCVSSIELFR